MPEVSDSAFRTAFHTWDRKELNNLEDAISVCMIRWMTERSEGNTGTDPATHHVRQLAAYLKSENLVQEQKAKPIEPMWTDKIPSDRQLKGGEANLGGRVFRRSCALCHSSDGSGPGPSLVRNGYSRYQIAKKIRGIENEGLDGLVMPSFPQDRLSDRELLNAVEFVYQM